MYTLKSEQEVIIAKAILILKSSPDITIMNLYRQATRELGLQTATQVPWFAKAIRQAKINMISKNDLVIKEQPKVIEQTKNIGFQFVEEIIEYKKSIDITLEYIKNRLDQIDNKINSFRGLLQNILGDLANYEVKEEPKEIGKIKKQLPHIAIIGPLKNQYDEISNKVGAGKAKLYFLDKDKNINQYQMKEFDYIFISRHCKHFIYWNAKAAIGDKKVFRIPGGIGSISDEITKVIKDNNV